MIIELKVQRTEGDPRKYTLTRLLDGSNRGESCYDADGKLIRALAVNRDRDKFFEAADRFHLELEQQGHVVSWKPLPHGESRSYASRDASAGHDAGQLGEGTCSDAK